MSPSSRRAWIEIFARISKALKLASPSSRRAWIEIHLSTLDMCQEHVALLAEGVDRNFKRKRFATPIA